MTYTEIQINIARETMIEAAAAKRVITYQEMANRLGVGFNAYSQKLWNLITLVAKQEMAAGRAILSAVVVNKKTRKPGRGFRVLVVEKYNSCINVGEIHTRELEKVYDCWASH